MKGPWIHLNLNSMTKFDKHLKTMLKRHSIDILCKAILNERNQRFSQFNLIEKWALYVAKAINNFIHIDEPFAICIFFINKRTV